MADAYALPVRLVNGHLSWTGALHGHFPAAQLAQVVDDVTGPINLPPDGIVLSESVARKLGVTAGQILRIELLAPA